MLHVQIGKLTLVVLEDHSVAVLRGGLQGQKLGSRQLSIEAAEAFRDAVAATDKEAPQ